MLLSPELIYRRKPFHKDYGCCISPNYWFTRKCLDMWHLFLRFGCKHNLWVRLPNACSRSYGQNRHSLEEAKRESKGNKAQSRTIHNKEDVILRKYCTRFSPLIFLFEENVLSLYTNNNSKQASVHILRHCWHSLTATVALQNKNPLNLFASVLHQKHDHWRITHY